MTDERWEVQKKIALQNVDTEHFKYMLSFIPKKVKLLQVPFKNQWILDDIAQISSVLAQISLYQVLIENKVDMYLSSSETTQKNEKKIWVLHQLNELLLNPKSWPIENIEEAQKTTQALLGFVRACSSSQINQAWHYPDIYFGYGKKCWHGIEKTWSDLQKYMFKPFLDFQ